MSCIITSGYSNRNRCTDNFGGVSKVYISNYDESNIVFINNDGAVAYMDAAEYFTFEQEIEQATFTDNSTNSVENGTSFFEPTLTIIITGLSVRNKETLNELSKGKFRILIMDQLGQFFLMGADQPVYCSGMTGGIGKVASDLNGMTVTFTSKSRVPTPIVLTDVAMELLVPIESDQPAQYIPALFTNNVVGFGIGGSISVGGVYDIRIYRTGGPIFHIYPLTSTFVYPQNMYYDTWNNLKTGDYSTRSTTTAIGTGTPNAPLIEYRFNYNAATTDSNPMFLWNDNTALTTVFPTQFTDVRGNTSKIAPVFYLNPYVNKIEYTLVASIDFQNISSNSEFTLVKITRTHSEIPTLISSIMTHDMEFYLVNGYPKGSVELVPDPTNPDVIYGSFKVGETFEIGVRTTYTFIPGSGATGTPFSSNVSYSIQASNA